jgi:FkbM family methyltransferase
VVAFEPCAQLMPYLRKNLAPTPVEVLGEAVGARTQTAQLQLGADLTAATVVPAAPAGDAHGQTCRMVGFDEVVAQLAQPISFLKLDCEGSEYEVFATAALEQVWQVAAELHSVAGQNPQTGLGMLQRRGFVIEAWRPFPGGAAGIVWARNTRWPARVGRP